ncbi:hypothetical protein CARUB_v10000167mg, partial [Capsella rubella]
MKLSLSLAFNATLLLLQVCCVFFAEARFSNETDMKALLEFKSQVSENKRELLASWNHSSPFCNWIGVLCGRKEGRVISLDLGGFKLAGIIPQEVGMLFRLQYLNMSYNLLQGRIPPSLSNCSRLLNLDLSSNHLGHSIPSQLGSLSKLVILFLEENNLTGQFPTSLGNLTSLQELDFAYNHMDGEIPDDVARLSQMVYFQAAVNQFSGVFPHALYNMSSLVYLSLATNRFSGNLRDDFGDLLPNLSILLLGENQITGAIPMTLTNISSLGRFHISYNYLTGSIPLSFGKLRNLWWLGISYNALGNNSFSGLEFIGALANCTQLEYLDVSYNKLGGELPASISNLSTILTSLSLGGNLIYGTIPRDIGNLESLQKLSLETNFLTGGLPVSFGKLLELRVLDLYSNAISGEIPSYFGNMTQLQKLHLNNNSFHGKIPQSLGRCQYLLDLWIDTNRLSGTIPQEILQIPSLGYIDLSDNLLTGHFPEEVGKLELLVGLGASNNRLSGQVPQAIGGCLSMEFLYMQGNSFEGAIPDIRRLVSLTKVDLSNNNLSGPIPRYLANLPLLQNLNLSMNKFEGRVPTIGVFRNASTVSVFGNENLCGGISYEELHNATNGFSSSNLIGSGNFGNVFKGLLGLENKLVAIKVLNLLMRGATKSFVAECEAFKRIRHRNLVKLITVCSSFDSEGNEFRALVYEFMPKGSLDMWLQSEDLELENEHSRLLTLAEKLNIAIDVASALEYLHVHCHDPLAHCDVKPSNVLLDDDLTAHVSDFGLARLLYKYDRESFLNQFSSAGVRGTIGYAAPEYGMGGQPSIQGDVYSFGILLLEMFAEKKPTDESFVGDYNLHSYTESLLSGCMSSGGSDANDECLRLVLQVGVRCSEEYPRDRMRIAEAVRELISIRSKFFSSKTTNKELSPRDAPQ